MFTSDMPQLSEVAQLLGASRPIGELRHAIARVARTDAKVLISGESGVGKEVVARHHPGGQRQGRPRRSSRSTAAACAETLLESELFGHVRGSFTGAHRDKAGKLELADSGTVFLDEIGETTPRMQGLLLRLLETGEIQKVGADDQSLRVDVRTIAATNRNLRELVAERAVPRGPVLPPERDQPDGAGAARAQGGRAGARRALSPAAPDARRTPA